jgi:hypothetical protein
MSENLYFLPEAMSITDGRQEKCDTMPSSTNQHIVTCTLVFFLFCLQIFKDMLLLVRNFKFHDCFYI